MDWTIQVTVFFPHDAVNLNTFIKRMWRTIWKESIASSETLTILTMPPSMLTYVCVYVVLTWYCDVHGSSSPGVFHLTCEVATYNGGEVSADNSEYIGIGGSRFFCQGLHELVHWSIHCQLTPSHPPGDIGSWPTHGDAGEGPGSSTKCQLWDTGDTWGIERITGRYHGQKLMK